MGIFDKLRGKMSLGSDYEDEIYDDEDYEDYGEPSISNRSVPSTNFSAPKKMPAPVIPLGGSTFGSQVHSVMLSEYEDAKDVCDRIKRNQIVVVNLEKVEYPLSQRIMDFLIGTCDALDGTVQTVNNNIYIIAPNGVEVSADFKEGFKTKNSEFPWERKS